MAAELEDRVADYLKKKGYTKSLEAFIEEAKPKPVGEFDDDLEYIHKVHFGQIPKPSFGSKQAADVTTEVIDVSGDEKPKNEANKRSTDEVRNGSASKKSRKKNKKQKTDGGAAKEILTGDAPKVDEALKDTPIENAPMIEEALKATPIKDAPMVEEALKDLIEDAPMVEALKGDDAISNEATVVQDKKDVRIEGINGDGSAKKTRKKKNKKKGVQEQITKAEGTTKGDEQIVKADETMNGDEQEQTEQTTKACAKEQDAMKFDATKGDEESKATAVKEEKPIEVVEAPSNKKKKKGKKGGEQQAKAGAQVTQEESNATVEELTKEKEKPVGELPSKRKKGKKGDEQVANADTDLKAEENVGNDQDNVEKMEAGDAKVMEAPPSKKGKKAKNEVEEQITNIEDEKAAQIDKTDNEDGGSSKKKRKRKGKEVTQENKGEEHGEKEDKCEETPQEQTPKKKRENDEGIMSSKKKSKKENAVQPDAEKKSKKKKNKSE